MHVYEVQRHKVLIMAGDMWDSYRIPWDLKTIFDLDLSIDDFDFLQCGGYLSIGDFCLHLEEDLVTA